MTGPRNFYFCWWCYRAASIPCIPKCMTEEQVWLLICAVASMRLSVPPSRWPLPCWTIPSKGGILFFIVSGTTPVHLLKSLVGSLGTQGSDLTQNQNTLKSFPSSIVESFFPVPSFCWRLEGERKEITNNTTLCWIPDSSHMPNAYWRVPAPRFRASMFSSKTHNPQDVTQSPETLGDSK